MSNDFQDSLGDLAFVDYADLLASLQKDLQLNAATDLLPGSTTEAVINDTGPHGTIQLADKQTLLKQLGVVFSDLQISSCGANAPITIAHGLGSVPRFAGGFPIGWNGYLYVYQDSDATNIYLAPSVQLSNNYIFWIAIA